MDANDYPLRPNPLARIRMALGLHGDGAHGRMEAVRQRYVRTRRDTLLRRDFDLLLHDLCERPNPEADPDEDRGRREANLMLVLGESGAGKTRSIQRLFSTHPATVGYGVPGAECPVISVSAPSPCGVKELGRAVLAATGYELVRKNVTGPEMWGIVHRRLHALGIVILHIDEAQHATQHRDATERQKLRNTFKAMLVDPVHPVAVLLSGLPEIADFVAADGQLSRRATWLKLASVELPTDLAMLKAAVAGFAELAGLRIEEDLPKKILPRLVHAGDHRLGIVIEEVHGAIRSALGDKSETLDLEHFAKSFAERTGNLPDMNPYRRSDFRAVDVWKKSNAGAAFKSTLKDAGTSEGGREP